MQYRGRGGRSECDGVVVVSLYIRNDGPVKMSAP